MTRLQVFLAGLVLLVAWVVVRRVRNRARRGAVTPQPAGLDEINRWYAAARETLSSMEPSERASREERWEALGDEEKLDLSVEFLRDRFGRSAPGLFTRDEKLALGRAHAMTR